VEAGEVVVVTEALGAGALVAGGRHQLYIGSSTKKSVLLTVVAGTVREYRCALAQAAYGDWT
jgi:hypothetical protein